MGRRLGLILTIAVLVVLLLQNRSMAQGAANFQADINQLRLQVSQLQSQVAQLAGRQSYPVPGTPSPNRAPRRPGDPTDAQIIDRLATLAIEAKDRLNALESRIARLEQRINAR